jgi:hypothetical protein
MGKCNNRCEDTEALGNSLTVQLGMVGIDLDPVIADTVFDRFAVQGARDEIGILDRHMAVDALAGELCAKFGEESAAFCLVTCEAFLCVGRSGKFRSMKIMARSTSHVGRSQITAASLQQ